jgi:hypothetical protein
MDNIRLHQLLNKLDHRMCNGGKYNSHCYGKNARVLRFGDDDNQLFAECVFDSNTLNVYELGYLQGKNEQGQTIKYLWRHPDYKVAYRKEAALLRESNKYIETPYKQVSLDGVLDSIRQYLEPKIN